MARPLRIEIEDGIYHVTSRGLERRAVARDDRDRRRWLKLLGDVAARREWRVLAYALMDNHFHLFVRTPRADLSAGMHDLNSGYATWFNRRHERVGPLFQGRFKAILVERSYHYWELSRYIHLNPVRAGLVARPEDWQWGSCRFYFSTRGVPEWLAWQEVLCDHGRTVGAARRAYRTFLAEGLSSSARSPLAGVVASTLLGTPVFIERIIDRMQGRLPEQEVPAAKQLRRELTPAAIAEAVARQYALAPDALRVRDRKEHEAREVAVYLARAHTRLPLDEIGGFFGGVSGAAIWHTVRSVERRRAESRALRKRLRGLGEVLGQIQDSRSDPT